MLSIGGGFDDFEAGSASHPAAFQADSADPLVGAWSDNFNRGDTANGYGSDWGTYTPYSGRVSTAGRVEDERAVIGRWWTAAVPDASTGTDSHYAEIVVDVGDSTSWVGPAVRMNSTGNQGYAVPAQGGSNRLRLYRVVDNRLGTPVMAVDAGTVVDGKTLRIEADSATIEVLVDGETKMTWTDTSDAPWSGAGHYHAGVLGRDARFDDFVTTNAGPTGAGSRPMSTVHLSIAGETLGVFADGVYTAVAGDHLGSGSVQRDFTNRTVMQRYTPYGAVREMAGNQLVSDRTFTGQTDDPGTGLIDYNARHYDPQLGRFVMADPVLDGLNRYSDVRNNPLVWTDPSGYCAGGTCYGGEDAAEFSIGNDTRFDGVFNSSDGTHSTCYIGQLQADCGSDAFGRGGAASWESAVNGIAYSVAHPLESAKGAAHCVSYFPFCVVETARSAAAECTAVKEKGYCAGYITGEEFLTIGTAGFTRGPSLASRVIRATSRARRAPSGAADDLLRAACRTNSFVPGTEVLLADGTTKPIEDIEIGDWVWAHEPETGETCARQVVDTIVGDGEKQLVDIKVLRDTVTATDGHPFWVTNDGAWIGAEDLEVGDRLLLAGGHTTVVLKPGSLAPRSMALIGPKAQHALGLRVCREASGQLTTLRLQRMQHLTLGHGSPATSICLLARIP